MSATVRSEIQVISRSDSGIRKTAATLGVGTGATQRIEAEMSA
jgi:hypothetical protein